MVAMPPPSPGRGNGNGTRARLVGGARMRTGGVGSSNLQRITADSSPMRRGPPVGKVPDAPMESPRGQSPRPGVFGYTGRKPAVPPPVGPFRSTAALGVPPGQAVTAIQRPRSQPASDQGARTHRGRGAGSGSRPATAATCSSQDEGGLGATVPPSPRPSPPSPRPSPRHATIRSRAPSEASSPSPPPEALLSPSQPRGRGTNLNAESFDIPVQKGGDYAAELRAAQLKYALWDKFGTHFTNMRRAFKNVDAYGDGSGQLNLEEFEKWVYDRYNMHDYSKEDIRRVWEDMDSDGSGKVGCDKFVEAMDRERVSAREMRRALLVDYDATHMSEERLARKMRDYFARSGKQGVDAFLTMDRNKNGVVTVGEAVDAIVELGIGATHHDASKLLRQADVDGDGTMDFHEFMARFLESDKHHRKELGEAWQSSSRRFFKPPMRAAGAEGGEAGDMNALSRAKAMQYLPTLVRDLAATYGSLSNAIRALDTGKTGDLAAAAIREALAGGGTQLAGEHVDAALTLLAKGSRDGNHVASADLLRMVEEPGHNENFTVRPAWVGRAAGRGGGLEPRWGITDGLRGVPKGSSPHFHTPSVHTTALLGSHRQMMRFKDNVTHSTGRYSRTSSAARRRMAARGAEGSPLLSSGRADGEWALGWEGAFSEVGSAWGRSYSVPSSRPTTRPNTRPGTAAAAGAGGGALDESGPLSARGYTSGGTRGPPMSHRHGALTERPTSFESNPSLAQPHRFARSHWKDTSGTVVPMGGTSGFARNEDRLAASTAQQAAHETVVAAGYTHERTKGRIAKFDDHLSQQQIEARDVRLAREGGIADRKRAAEGRVLGAYGKDEARADELFAARLRVRAEHRRNHGGVLGVGAGA